VLLRPDFRKNGVLQKDLSHLHHDERTATAMRCCQLRNDVSQKDLSHLHHDERTATTMRCCRLRNGVSYTDLASQPLRSNGHDDEALLPDSMAGKAVVHEVSY